MQFKKNAVFLSVNVYGTKVLIGKLSMQPRRRRHQKPHLKKHRRSFKLYRFCFITLNLPNVREFFASWVLKVCISIKKKKRKRKIVVLCSHSQWNVKLRSFTSLSCSDGKETKIPNARTQLLLSKPPFTRIRFQTKTDIFFSGWAYLPHSLMQWNWSPKTHLFKNALQSLDFWKRRLFFDVWTDENGFEFGIRWCHTSYF